MKQNALIELVKNRVCVIDNGTGYTKMGLAGNVYPCFDIPTVVADHVDRVNSFSSTVFTQTPKLTNNLLDFHIGNEAYEYANTHNIIYPMKSGVIENWDLMEKFWHRSIFDYLRIEPEETVFLLTEKPINPPENRETIAEIFFETFNAKGLHLAAQATLSLYSVKLKDLTGLVLDSGDGATHIVPVAEGYVIGSCVQHFPLTGRDISQFIQNILKERNEQIPQQDLKKITQAIKEKYGYCVKDGNLVAEFEQYDSKNGVKSKKFKRYHGKPPITKEKYQVNVGYERFLGPELFFHPEMIYGNSKQLAYPIDKVIDKAIQVSPIDYRKRLYNNIVLSGGAHEFKGFRKRLQNQVQKRIDNRLLKYQLRSGVQPNPIPVVVEKNSFQRCAVWQGGSLMGLNPRFNEVYHTREQYMEIGPQIARHNAVFQSGS